MVVGWGLWRDPEINNAIFRTQIFHLKSPLPICSHNISKDKLYAKPAEVPPDNAKGQRPLRCKAEVREADDETAEACSWLWWWFGSSQTRLFQTWLFAILRGSTLWRPFALFLRSYACTLLCTLRSFADFCGFAFALFCVFLHPTAFRTTPFGSFRVVVEDRFVP